MGHESGERDRERVGRERERERVHCGERESVLQGNRESGTREKEREREWGICEKSKRESLFRDARRKVKHRNGGRKKKKRGLKGDNESEAKRRDCGESVSPSCRHP